mmetsp:Transcript_7432/g.9713  ORF Transcript_7432/g.9713 Transcript_7432/m.9713 type:complete len:293 (-) Transcript_7432:266-1144(-)
MQKRKRSGASVKGGTKKDTHSYECIVHGVVDGSKVKTFLQRLDGLTNDKARKTELYSVLEMVFANDAKTQEVMIRRTTELYKESGYVVPTMLEGVPNSPYWSLIIYGNYFRGADYTTPVRSILESKVSNSIEGFVTTLGLTKTIETGRIGRKLVTEELIEVELFRLITPASLLSFRKKDVSQDEEKTETAEEVPSAPKRTSGKPSLDALLPTVTNPMGATSDAEKLNPDEVVYLLPPGVESVEKSPLLLTVRAKADTEKSLSRTSSALRTFISKLGKHFQEIDPEKLQGHSN